MLTKRDVLRDVELRATGGGFRLTVWEIVGSPRMSTGQKRLAYEFRNPQDEVLFAGDDYGCSPCHAIDSDAMLRALLGFLTNVEIHDAKGKLVETHKGTAK